MDSVITSNDYAYPDLILFNEIILSNELPIQYKVLFAVFNLLLLFQGIAHRSNETCDP